jgi:hypothetical protein
MALDPAIKLSYGRKAHLAFPTAKNHFVESAIRPSAKLRTRHAAILGGLALEYKLWARLLPQTTSFRWLPR